MTTCSSSLSGSLQASRFDTSSAPVIKNNSSSGERSPRMLTVSTLCIGRPASISTLSTEKRSFSWTAASTIASRSGAVALTLEASLCGGMPPGTKTTRARSNSVMTCSATIRCPWCTGSKVPPKIPTLTPTSLEIEYGLTDPDTIARHRAGSAQRSYHANPLQFVLEAFDTLPVAPVGLEREPFDALTRDDVATVLLLHPDTLPRRPEHAMLTLRNSCWRTLLPHFAQLSIESVAQYRDAFRRLSGDLVGPRKGFLQIRPQLFIEEVDLVQHDDDGLLGESGGVELGPQRTLGPFGIFAGVEHEREQPRPRHVAEKLVAEALALAGPRDEAGDVCHHEPSAVSLIVHDSELGREGGERIVTHPGTRGAQHAQQRRFSRVGQSDEADVREDLELQADLAFLAGETLLSECRSLAGGGREGTVPTPTLAP